MTQHANFNFIDQKVVSTQLLLFDQSQFAKLFKMVIGYAGAAKVQGTLNFSDALGRAAFEKVPVDFPGFAAQGIFQFGFFFSVQAGFPRFMLGVDGYKPNS